MIEQRMIEKGITKQELEHFANLDNHNGKKDVFRKILGRGNMDELNRYSDSKFLTVLNEVLQDEANKIKQRKHHIIYDEKLVASRMFRTLLLNQYPSFQELTLDQLYQDTIKRYPNLSRGENAQ
ncbi:MAG: hypothetical protein ABIB79_01525 [archaeon]